MELAAAGAIDGMTDCADRAATNGDRKKKGQGFGEDTQDRT